MVWIGSPASDVSHPARLRWRACGSLQYAARCHRIRNRGDHGRFENRAFAGIVMVAVIAVVIERSLLGSNSMFQVPPHPDSHALGTLVWSLVLGLLAGLVPDAFVEALLVVREIVKLIRGRYDWMMLGVGGLAIGLIGAAVFASWGKLRVFGIGYSVLSAALSGSLGLALMVALHIGKFAATVFSYDSGGACGIFAPTLFIGAMLGGIVGALAHLAGSQSSSMSSALALVGIGAMLGGTILAPVTSILIIFELGGDYALILPIIAANLSSYAIANKLRRVPICEALLLQDGINLRKFTILRPDRGWQNLPVSTITTNTVRNLETRLALARARLEIENDRSKIYPVVDGNYIGLVHKKWVKFVGEKEPDKQVREIFVAKENPKVYPEISIRVIANRFVDTEWSEIPVVSRLSEEWLIRIVTLHNINRQQILQEKDME